MDIFQRAKDLNLPWGHYVVFGGGPLAARGIRETADVDLFVTSTLYEQLKRDGWTEKELLAPASGVYLSKGIYDANDTWRYGDYDSTPEAIIAIADIINGLPFAPLAEVLKWKEAYGRPKDLEDIRLIEHYVNHHD